MTVTAYPSWSIWGYYPANGLRPYLGFKSGTGAIKIRQSVLFCPSAAGRLVVTGENATGNFGGPYFNGADHCYSLNSYLRAAWPTKVTMPEQAKHPAGR